MYCEADREEALWFMSSSIVKVTCVMFLGLDQDGI